MMSSSELVRDQLRTRAIGGVNEASAEQRTGQDKGGPTGMEPAPPAQAQAKRKPPKRRGSKTAEDFVMHQEQLRTLGALDELTPAQDGAT